MGLNTDILTDFGEKKSAKTSRTSLWQMVENPPVGHIRDRAVVKLVPQAHLDCRRVGV